MTDPTRKAIVRPDTGAILGIFRTGYKVHDYDQWLIHNVEGILDADLHIGSAGLLRGGAVAWVQVEMADTLNAAGAGSSGALPRRSPLRTGRASCPRIRLKQAHWRRGMVQSGRCAVRPCGRRGHAQGVKLGDRLTVRVAGRR